MTVHEPSDERLDFFVSYCRGDLPHALWITAELETAGFSTRVQALDFPPGSNFVVEMDDATREAERTLLVLSSDSLESRYVRAEWASRFSEDPDGSERKLIPVRVDDVAVTGLLRAVVYIDLFGKDEQAAREALLTGIRAAVGNASRTDLLRDVPYPRSAPGGSSQFVGFPLRRTGFSAREQELRSIDSALRDPDSSRVVAVHGLGGVGKSRLATEWAHRSSTRYTVACWVRATDDLVRKTDLAKLALRLGVTTDERDIDAGAAAAMRWLETNDDWLVVLDDVTDLAAAAESIPSTGGGDVLLTSRFGGDWTTIGAVSIGLDVFSEDEGTAFLQARTGDSDRESARTITLALGHLPLALEQAGSYVTSLALTLEAYCERLRLHRPSLLQRGGPTDHAETIATTWRMAFEELHNDFPAEVILSFCAYCAADGLPRRLFDLQRSLGDVASDLAAQPLAIDDGLAALLRFSLITIEPTSIAMHPLVQEAARASAEPDRADNWCSAIEQVLLREFPEEARDIETITFARDCLPHGMTITEHVTARGGASEATVELLRKMGSFLTWQLQTGDAAQLLERAIALAEAIEGHPQHLALTLNSLAAAQVESGHPGVAEVTLSRALELMQRSGAPPTAVATMLAHLGATQRQQGKVAAAQSTLRRALELMEASVAEDDVALVPVLTNLANATSDAAIARALLERALAIADGQPVVDEHVVVTIKTNLSNVHNVADARLKAVELAGEAVRRAEASYGLDHPRLIPLLVNLATSLYEAGDVAAAVPVAYRAVRLEERVADIPGNRRAETLMVLARCEQRAGAERASYKTFLLAYRVAERGDAPAVAASALSSAGDLARELGELAPAERLLGRALAMHRSASVEDSDYAMTLTRLGSVRRAQRRPADAVQLHRAASEILLVQSPESSAAMNALSNLGNALGEIGEIADAIEALRRAYRIAMRLYGVGHPDTWTVAVNLAMPLLWSRQEAAAREVLAEAQGIDPEELELRFIADDE